jgi:hypothetical protein
MDLSTVIGRRGDTSRPHLKSQLVRQEPTAAPPGGNPTNPLVFAHIKSLESCNNSELLRRTVSLSAQR